MSEKDSFVTEYYDNIKKKLDKNAAVVLYGTGQVTIWAMEVCKDSLDCNLIGIMDSNSDVEDFYGYPVLKNPSDNRLKDADILIIMNRNPGITQMIYQRICDMLPGDLKVLDIKGDEIKRDDLLSDENDRDTSICDQDSLLAQIECSDVVSFDVFDTLVARKIPSPEDLFALMEGLIKAKYGISDFAHRRHEAAYIATKEKGYPTLAEIYEVLVRDFSSEAINVPNLADRLCEEELRAEKTVLFKKNRNIELFDHAVNKGKRVCIVSDTYYSLPNMKRLLRDAGIRGIDSLNDSDYFLSCDMHASKEDGEMWKKFKAVIGSSVHLHFGDSEAFDIYNAKRDGLKSVFLQNSHDKWKTKGLSDCRDLSYMFQRGLLQARLFNDPFEDCRIDTLFDYGYCIIAPLVFNYLLWILKEVENKYSDIDKRTVYFVARDGFFTEKLFALIADRLGVKVKTDYLYLSRAFLEYLCYSPAELAEKIHFSGKLSDLMLYRFNYTLPQSVEDRQVSADDEITSIISSYIEEISSRREISRERYRSYLQSVGVLDQKDKVVIVDPSYRGSGQYMLSQFSGMDTEGYYCYADLSKDNPFFKNNMLAFYNDKNDPKAENLFLHLYFCVFEASIMVSPEGSVRDIGEDGFVLTPPGITQLQFADKEETYKGVKQYFTDVLKMAEHFDALSVIEPQKELPMQVFEKAIKGSLSVSPKIKDTLYDDSFYDKISTGINVAW